MVKEIELPIEWQASVKAFYLCKRLLYKPFALKEEYISEGYTKLLEQKDKKELDLEEMIKISANKMKLRSEQITENNYRLEHVSKSSDNTTSDNGNVGYIDFFLQNDCVNEEMNYKALFDLFVDFLNSYSDCKTRKLIYLNIIKGLNLAELRKIFKMTLKEIAEVIKTFRLDFLNYLKSVDYFDNTTFLEKRIKQLTKQERGHLKKISKKFDNTLCVTDDFKIYELLRADIDNLDKYAKFLNVKLGFLNSVIFHKVGFWKLKLFQIYKLQKKFFKQYTFDDLVVVLNEVV